MVSFIAAEGGPVAEITAKSGPVTTIGTTKVLLVSSSSPCLDVSSVIKSKYWGTPKNPEGISTVILAFTV